jgi:hypothetical protein
MKKEEEMEKLVKIALTAVLLISLNQVASAQQLQMPKQGTTTYQTYYTNRYLSTLNMGVMGSGWVAELYGITRNTDEQKSFDRMLVHCIYYFEAVMGGRKHSGACIHTDGDGDKVFTTFEGETMSHTLIGGTGKYIGISGTAAYGSKDLPTHGEGLTSIIADHKVTWELK